MAPSLTTRIVRIGNSQGIRIPKTLLQQLGLADEVVLEVQENQLIIRPLQQSRQHWEAHFQQMALAGDDQLIDNAPTSTEWDKQEWSW